MIRQIVSINWRYIGDAVPAFVTVIFVPFSYSAAYGLIAGLMVYTALNGLVWITKLVSGSRIVPDDEDHREYWTITPQGKLPWFITTGQTLAGYLGHNSNKQNTDSSSIGSGESSWKYQDQLNSKASNRELQTVALQPLPTDPKKEKVLIKM